jgi:hypothetical protein
VTLPAFGQGSFPASAGIVGTTAVHKDSSSIVAWAAGCEVDRGYMNIADTSLGLSTFGVTADALGASNPSILSLGDSGSATLTFNGSIFNGPGPDFAIFENSFSDSFLELAFVEVSSDGLNFFRFPATSTTPDTSQIDGFGFTDATHLNNLAGKYRAQFGTPFDLQEMTGIIGLDINDVRFVKLIDCVGSINPLYASYDQFGYPINDPFPTPFPSSGFDLDAIGVMNFSPATDILTIENAIKLYPNPTSHFLQIDANGFERVELFDIQGRLILQSMSSLVDLHKLPAGQYVAKIFMDSVSSSHLIFKR